jgi:hypothetical protein
VIDALIGQIRNEKSDRNPCYQDHYEAAHGQKVDERVPKTLFRFRCCFHHYTLQMAKELPDVTEFFVPAVTCD